MDELCETMNTVQIVDDDLSDVLWTFKSYI